MLSREDYINQICYRASIIRKNPESPHLDKTEEDQPGHYPYIAYQKGISSLLSRDMTVKKHRSQRNGAF